LSLLSACLASTTREPKNRQWHAVAWHLAPGSSECGSTLRKARPAQLCMIAALHRDGTIADLQALAPLESSTLFVCCVMRTATQLQACPNFARKDEFV
jgi:hypothetical protein